MFTVSGLPIELSTGVAKPSPSMARLAKLTTCLSAGISGESFGSDPIVPWTIVREFFSPSSGTFWPRNVSVPPLRVCCRSLTATRSTCLETACSTWATRELIACSANCRSSGSLVFRIRSTVGFPTPCVIRLLIWEMMSAGMISAAAAWPLRTLSIASAREFTLIASID